MTRRRRRHTTLTITQTTTKTKRMSLSRARRLLAACVPEHYPTDLMPGIITRAAPLHIPGLTEATHQARLVANLSKRRDIDPKAILHPRNAVSSEGARIIGPAQGVVKGASDLLILSPYVHRGVYRPGLAIELKAEPTSESNEDQVAFLAAMRRAGWIAEYCVGQTEGLLLAEACYGRPGSYRLPILRPTTTM